MQIIKAVLRTGVVSGTGHALREAHGLGADVLDLQQTRQRGGASELQAQIAAGHRPRNRQA